MLRNQFPESGGNSKLWSALYLEIKKSIVAKSRSFGILAQPTYHVISLL